MIQTFIKKITHHAVRKKPQFLPVPDNSRFLSIVQPVTIHPDCRIESTTVIDRGTRINGPMTVKGHGKLQIGRYVAIGDELIVITSNHETKTLNLQVQLQITLGLSTHSTDTSTVYIGDNCWIGDRVTILPGATIGPGTIVGAGSVVTKRNFPPFSVIAGNPAKFIRSRFSEEIINFLLDIDWCNWDIERIKRNKKLFDIDLTNISNINELRNLIND